MPANAARKILWWVCLIIAPTILAGIELFHPAHFTAEPGMYEFLSKSHPRDPSFVALAYFGPGWWFTLHMIQTPLVGLVSIGLWQLVDRIDNHDIKTAQMSAWLSRTAMFVFLIYYTALDAIGGLGVGRSLITVKALDQAGRLSKEQLEGIVLFLDTMWADPWVGGLGSFISQTGSYAVLTAGLSAALALFLSKYPPAKPGALVCEPLKAAWRGR